MSESEVCDCGKPATKWHFLMSGRVCEVCYEKLQKMVERDILSLRTEKTDGFGPNSKRIFTRRDSEAAA